LFLIIGIQNSQEILLKLLLSIIELRVKWMEIPNPYKFKNYKLLIIFPSVLILLSLYFIPKIPTGLDLRGGTLLTVHTNSSFNEDALSDSLKKELGVREVSINQLQNPLGSKVEIEIEQNERIAAGERDMRNFYSKVEEVDGLEYDISRFKADLERGNLTQFEKDDTQKRLNDAQTRLPKAKEEMNVLADSVINDYEFFVGKIDRSNATDTTTLESLLANTSTTAKQKYKEKILEVINSHMKIDEFSLKDVSPSLSEFFIANTQWAVGMSFVLTAIVVILIFRSFIPSVAVLAGAIADIIIALGGMGLFQVPLTLPSIAALLMLIGFSLDTDILLTTRVMRRSEGTPRDRAYEAMKTGVMMAFVSIIGFSALFILSLLTQISTYYQISAVAIFGLVGDIFATWCTNAVIVLWDVERKAKGAHK
jgi:preprotein translocase subunit SecF